jgi:hypothetical protein
MSRQSKKEKGKQPASFPYIPKTRPTNKIRLKSKALFKPSLKEDNLIILEDDSPEQNPEKGKMVCKYVRKKSTRASKRGKKLQPMFKIESSQSDEGLEHDPNYCSNMQELSNSYMEKEYSPRKYVKEEIIEETSSKEKKHYRKGKKPKISIGLNIYASVEENQSVNRETMQIEPIKHGIEEYHMTIKELKQENKALEVWNGKLHERIQRLKEKHKSQCELLNKVRKTNIKL